MKYAWSGCTVPARLPDSLLISAQLHPCVWARHAAAPGNSQPTKKDKMMFDRTVSIHKLILTDSTPTAEQVLTRNGKLLTSSTLILPLKDQPAKNCVPLLIINKLVHDLSSQHLI